MSKKMLSGSEEGIHYAINEATNQGWEEQGSVVFESRKLSGSDDEYWFYAQTMTKTIQSPFR